MIAADPTGGSEVAFQRQVLDLAKFSGWDYRYHTYDSRHSAAGFPDLVLVRHPRVIFAELKTSTGRIMPAQVAWLDELAQCPGVEAYLWRPADLAGQIRDVLSRNYRPELEAAR